MGNILKKHFTWFGGLGPKSRLFLIYQPTTINQKLITISWWFFILWKSFTKTIESSKHHQLRINKLHYTAILLSS